MYGPTGDPTKLELFWDSWDTHTPPSMSKSECSSPKHSFRNIEYLVCYRRVRRYCQNLDDLFIGWDGWISIFCEYHYFSLIQIQLSRGLARQLASQSWDRNHRQQQTKYLKPGFSMLPPRLVHISSDDLNRGSHDNSAHSRTASGGQRIPQCQVWISKGYCLGQFKIL